MAAVVLTAALAAVAYVPDPNGTGVHPGDGDFEVWAMNADGSDQRQLTHTADGEGPVAWLRDGRIVSSSFHGNRPMPDWYLMNLDGTGVRSLPQLRGAGDPIDWLAPVR